MDRHVFLLVVGLLCVSAQLVKGNTCTFDDGTEGECTTVADCPGTREQILRGIVPKVCSYVQDKPIVCCLSATTKPRGLTTSNKVRRGINSKAETMCQEYAQYVYWESHSPLLTVVKKRVNESTCAITGQKLIVGGVKAVSKEFPHMAALGFGNEGNIEWACGGSLISERYILTAAHCMYAPGRGLVRWARLGDLNLETSDDDAEDVTIAISERTRHPDYKTTAHYHDIALVKLVKDVTFSRYIRPACLHMTPGDPPNTINSTASGWGKLLWNAHSSDDLMKVDLTLQPAVRCNTTYNDLIRFGNWLKKGIDPDTMICAGDPQGKKDTCGGDSGGPLQIRLTKPYCMYSIIGLTSFGVVACGVGDNPAIYTRVSHYVPWIEGIVWP